jgi:hypothetical protein
MSQTNQILNYLKTGKTLTSLEALYEFGSFRLSARIFELKEKGWPIDCDCRDTGSNKKVGHYSLSGDTSLWPK